MVSEHASPLAVLGGVDAGGQNVYVSSLSRALGDLGCEVVVYTRRDEPTLAHRVGLSPGVTVEHVDAGPARSVAKDELLPHMGAFARRLRRAWSTEPPDVVHAHFWMSGLAALEAARPLHLPLLQTFHALGVVKRRHQGAKDTSPETRISTERSIIASVDRIVATCSDELFELVRLGAQPNRITVVPCGVDLDLFRPEGPALPRTPGLLRVVAISRLVERKGIGNLISAIGLVPGCELLVAGGPPAARLDNDPEVERYRRLAVEVGVVDRVRFLGSLPRDQIPQLIRSADVVACVPWYEPFGIVPLEAMACGVPVLAAAVGGLVDTVVDGVTGVHVPPRRPREVARVLRWLLADEAARAAMGAQGIERAQSRYGWSSVAEAMLEAYQSSMPVVVAMAKARRS